MSNHQIDEYELGEHVRTWFKQNSGSLITGIALGLGCIAAWNWWDGNGKKHDTEAALQFQAFSQAIEKSDDSKSNIVLSLLESKYADTPYLEFAVLRQAELLQSNGKNDEALKLLQSYASKASDQSIKELFQIRIARLQFISGKSELALTALSGIKESIYSASLEEIRGDAEFALGKRELASKSYVKALTALDEAAPVRNLIELKLIESGGSLPAKPGA